MLRIINTLTLTALFATCLYKYLLNVLTVIKLIKFDISLPVLT